MDFTQFAMYWLVAGLVYTLLRQHAVATLDGTVYGSWVFFVGIFVGPVLAVAVLLSSLGMVLTHTIWNFDNVRPPARVRAALKHRQNLYSRDNSAHAAAQRRQLEVLERKLRQEMSKRNK
jgi:uncharacterized membrane protein YccC